ncbi:MAG: MarR family transcriptional regulator [Erysipelotrichaceae bacterium]|nr:MarR family transcriptional regulator [Erysipelotrichaceae bacterium]
MYRDPIGQRIKTLNKLMKKSMDKSMGQRPDKATLMHSLIIGYLQDREDSHIDTFQKDIEKEFSINRSTTSEMLTLMSQKGMIERIPVDYDARLKKIILTDQSRCFNQRLSQSMEILHNKFKKGLTNEEIETFITICDKIIENIKNDLE